MIDHHVLLEAARHNTQKRHPIAMLRVHVRLNLEHKAGELVVRRLHDPLRAHARARRGRELEEPVQKWLDAEVRQRAPEEYRRELAGEKAVAIELGAGAGQQGNLILQRTIGLSQRLSQARVGEDLHPHRRSALVMQRPLKKQDLRFLKVVQPLKPGPFPDRPIEGDSRHAQGLLDLLEQFVRMASRQIHLIDEGHNRDVAFATDGE